MQILLHAGFHKSGTTSIQRALLRDKNADFIYPSPRKNGPGHSDIALTGQNQNSPKYDPDVLVKLINRLSKRFFFQRNSMFVLSSEDFTATSNFEAIKRLTKEHDVHLVLTRRPVSEALPSFQQEMIKHGSAHPFLSNLGLMEAEKHIQFDIDRIHNFLNSSNFRKITVISTTSSRPDFIFENFNKILDAKLETRTENVGLSESVLQELTRLNSMYPNQKISKRIRTAVHLVEPSEKNAPGKTINQTWELMEKKLINYFTALSNEGFIEFISAK